VLGVGIGGSFDGIFLHQVFQAHHMLSNAGDDRLRLDPYPTDTVDGLEVNTLWDGLFHMTTYTFVVAGLLWLWYRLQEQPTGTRLSPRFLIGGVFAGWGVFNLVEGIVNHHLLAIHHVYDGDLRLLWDLLFLAAGAALLAVGLWLMKREVDARETA
jgi:uncharacterized membrane protein